MNRTLITARTKTLYLSKEVFRFSPSRSQGHVTISQGPTHRGKHKFQVSFDEARSMWQALVDRGAKRCYDS